jgi:pimeloyl-ACP methyl ester carboxylesterase
MIGSTIVGTGSQKIIVCHGWMGDYTVFNPTIQNLDLMKYTYAFVDYRGYGKSKDQKGSYSIEEIANDVIAFAKDQGWDKFNLIGHSMGGLVVQKVLSLASDQVQKIVAITPVPANGYAMDPDSQALFDGAVENIDNRRTILDFTTGNRLSGVWLDQMTQACLDTTTKESYKGYLEAWTKTDITSEIEGKTHDILVCVGENDPALPKEMMENTFMKWYPNAKLEILPNAGHYPMQETPVYLATVIENFLG